MNALHVAERSAAYALEDAVAPMAGGAFDLLATARQGVAKLRELILSLAVHGRLVAQSPADIPASQLLEQISAGRKAQPAVRRTRRRNGRPHSSDEMPFDVPGSWTWVGLADVTYEHGQQTPSAPFTYIDVASIDSVRGCIRSDLPIVAASDAPSRARKLVKKDTVIYSTVRPYLKNIAIVDEAYDPMPIASTAFAVLHPNDGLLSKYLYYYLRSAEFTSFVASRMIGVAYPAINDASFFEGVLPLPPLAEQRRIVARVEELMGLCDELETRGRLQDEQHARLVATLFDALVASTSPEELADNWQRIASHFDLLLDRPAAVDALEQTILQLAVRGLLVPQDPAEEPASALLQRICAQKDQLIAEGKIKHAKRLPPITDEEHPFELPTGWQWARVGSVGVTQTGGTPASNKPEYFDGNFPFIGPGQITPSGEVLRPEKFISELGQTESAIAEPGDILMVCIGGSIGKCAAASFATAFNQQINSIHPLLVSNEFILSAMTTSNFVSAVVSTATGSATPIISKGKWDLLLLPIPPLAEQRRIVARVEELRSLCADLHQHLQQAQAAQSNLADTLVVRAAA